MSQVAAIFKIGNSKDIPDIPDHLSSEAKNFLKLCLQRDPADRPTAAQLIEHPWVKDQASVRSSRSGITRDMFPTSSDGNKTTVHLQSMTIYCHIVVINIIPSIWK
jgi:serine/threonine protein kinase